MMKKVSPICKHIVLKKNPCGVGSRPAHREALALWAGATRMRREKRENEKKMILII
jgi:hypothetical protein